MRKKTIDVQHSKILNTLVEQAGLTNKALSAMISLSKGSTLVRIQNLHQKKE